MFLVDVREGGLVFWVVSAMQPMWLQKLHPDMKVPYLCSEVVVLIKIWSFPLLVRFSHCPLLDSQFGCRSLK